MKKFLFPAFYLFIFLTFGCSSSQKVVPEPSLEQITIKTESICMDIKWWNPFSWFCSEAQSVSLTLRGVIDNPSGNKSYFLDYYMDTFEKDIPVGVSLKLEDTYYNLERSGIDYVETIKISSKISEEVLKKISEAKTIGFSYSNRSDSFNTDLSSKNQDKLKSMVSYVLETTNSQAKLIIVKK